jgi:hypothetical protein
MVGRPGKLVARKLIAGAQDAAVVARCQRPFCAHTRGPGVAYITKLKAVGECLAHQNCGVTVWEVGDGDVWGLYGGDRVGWPVRCPWTRGASGMGGRNVGGAPPDLPALAAWHPWGLGVRAGPTSAAVCVPGAACRALERQGAKNSLNWPALTTFCSIFFN